MNLSFKLQERAAANKPVRIGQVGAGKFGTMFLSQVRLTTGMHLVGLADLMPARAKERLLGVQWSPEQIDARSLGDALKTGKTHITDNAMSLIENPEIEVIIEATGDPGTGIKLCQAAINHGKHVVMVNVEADALAGPLLARQAREKGVVYSLAWGDQPALVCEHVDWARTCGFKVVAAGKGTRYHPTYHQSTPESVWDILNTYLKIQDKSHINPKMFNSFVDGTKSGIEMTAICNATGLHSQSDGLSFPPATRFEHADVCKPKADGGVLGEGGRDGGDVVALSRRQGRAAQSRHGNLHRVRERQRLRAEMLRGIQPAAGQVRQVCGAVPADPYDRAGAGGVGGVGGAAQGADRLAVLLQFGCGRHGQAHAQKGRDAGRRRRLLRLGQADAGGGVA